MKLEILNSLDLIDLANEKLLFAKLVQQLEKDFLLANVPWDVPVNLPAAWLVSSLREKIYYLMMERFSEYLNLLYIIDLPEKEFQNIELTDAVEVSNQMTFLILKREYQKVWFRNTYK